MRLLKLFFITFAVPFFAAQATSFTFSQLQEVQACGELFSIEQIFALEEETYNQNIYDQVRGKTLGVLFSQAIEHAYSAKTFINDADEVEKLSQLELILSSEQYNLKGSDLNMTQANDRIMNLKDHVQPLVKSRCKDVYQDHDGDAPELGGLSQLEFKRLKRSCALLKSVVALSNLEIKTYEENLFNDARKKALIFVLKEYDSLLKKGQTTIEQSLKENEIGTQLSYYASSFEGLRRYTQNFRTSLQEGNIEYSEISLSFSKLAHDSAYLEALMCH